MSNRYQLGSPAAMHYCPVTADLNRYLARLDAEDREEAARERELERLKLEVHEWPATKILDWLQGDDPADAIEDLIDRIAAAELDREAAEAIKYGPDFDDYTWSESENMR